MFIVVSVTIEQIKGFIDSRFDSSTEEILQESQTLSKSLVNRVDLDTEAFNAVMAAFKMAKETEQDKASRAEAIQNGYKEAVQSPLGIAQECLKVLQLARGLLGKSNSNALSDLGVASLQACAGLEGAIMNVKINIPSIKDEDFVAETSTEVSGLLEEGLRIKVDINKIINDEFG